MYKNISLTLTFINLPDFDLLSRPDKLLLIGLYDQWIAHNCVPMHLNDIDYKALIRLTGVADLDLDKLSAKKTRSLMRFGILFSDHSISFVLKPDENRPVDLTKSRNGKLRKRRRSDNVNGSKRAVRGQKPAITSPKRAVSGKNQAAKTETREVEAPKKPSLHPNFLASALPKKGKSPKQDS